MKSSSNALISICSSVCSTWDLVNHFHLNRRALLRAIVGSACLTFFMSLASLSADPDPNRPPNPSGRPTVQAPFSDPVDLPCGPGCLSHLDNSLTQNTKKGYYAYDYQKSGDTGWPESFPVRAAADGRIIIFTTPTHVPRNPPQAGCPDPQTTSNQGLAAAIDHGNGWQTFYLHLASYSVTDGASVKAGDIIGMAGCTGAKTIHLHFDLRWAGPTPPGITWTYPTDFQVPPSGLSVDIAFVIDTTGSMGDDIDAVKAAASQIIDLIKTEAPDSRIAVVEYRDFPSRTGDSGDFPYHDVQMFTSDPDVAKNAINNLTLGNGGDHPESLNCALMHTINSDLCANQGANTSIGTWRPIPAKFIVYLTDAPALSPEPFTGFTNQSSAKAANEGGFSVIGGEEAEMPVIPDIAIYPVVVGGDPTALRDATELAQATGGKVFTAPSASEAGNAIINAIQTVLQSPIADAGGLYNGAVGETITFNGGGSLDPDGTITLYEWDFESDGSFDVSSSNPTATHAYPETFSGMVTLRVTDNDGNTGADTAQIQITDATANLTVVKTVVNDHGGTKTLSDFPLFVDGTPVTSGVATTVTPGTHTVSEQNLPGYTATFSGDCNASGQVTVNAGESKTCIITNDDQSGSITIVKDAVPDDPQDFAFSGALGNFTLDDDPNNNTLNNQATFASLASGSYTVNEVAVNGWNMTAITCNDSDSSGNPALRSATINLASGESVTCTFTNQRQAGTVVGTCGGYTVYQNGSIYSAPGWSGGIKIGTSVGDTINGSSGADLILGLGGNDKLYGKGGDDVICGGDGNDLIEGAVGNDNLDGGNGNDLLRGQAGDYDILLGGDGNDGLFDPDGVDGIHGGAGTDLLTFALRKGWRDGGGATRFDHKLSGGYQDDVVLFTIFDRSTFFIDITGDERDEPSVAAEGRNDTLGMVARLDPASIILKFEHSLVKAADDDVIDQVTTMEQQYASEYSFVLSEPEDKEGDNHLFMPFVVR